MRYPYKKIVAIFKPDRFSRIHYFAHEFAESMKQADVSYLCHFPENAAHEAGIDIDITDIQQYIPEAKIISEDDEGARLLSKHENCVYLFMSSKDIYKLKDKVKKMKKV